MITKPTPNNESNSPTVFVILSTYNGEQYLEELLNSLLLQDYPSFQIVVRDDGSSDRTPEIIDSFCETYTNRIIRSMRLTGNIGVTRSFFSLLHHIKENSYLMFCDQDDVWFHNKISKFMDRMREVELSGVKPTLVFGDMIVTDQDLNVVSQSFWDYQRIEPSIASDWRRLMISNVVTGCSSMCNSAAVKLLRSIPDLPVLHDHLAAIIVARHGLVTALSEPTMFYRQHQTNLEGARAFGFIYLFTRLNYFLKVILPRYRILCEVFDVPIILAAYLKFESVVRRLVKIK